MYEDKKTKKRKCFFIANSYREHMVNLIFHYNVSNGNNDVKQLKCTNKQTRKTASSTYEALLDNIYKMIQQFLI